jgi:deoxyribose-phosphate aldolase
VRADRVRRGQLLDGLASHIDHALLDPFTGREDVHRTCQEAQHFSFAGVCLFSRWIAAAREWLPLGGPVRLISVIGFPFGAVPTAIKRAEAEAAAAAGADELDVVPDFGALAERDGNALLEDLSAVTDLGLPVKVILEVGRLDAMALELLVEVCVDAGARYLKTGSGFGPPVTPEQVRRVRDLARNRAAVKASGGIASIDQAVTLLEAGASRLGTSRGVALMEQLRQEERLRPGEAPGGSPEE